MRAPSAKSGIGGVSEISHVHPASAARPCDAMTRSRTDIRTRRGVQTMTAIRQALP
jgi:hypothetical protein